ncbi:hypothetical protein [Tenacibaculum xiamenense]|uniref:hypothetical protein n=1 Tax=Tenacibaculum xiamenense TaxID=1261553 RepID=UPI00389564CE
MNVTIEEIKKMILSGGGTYQGIIIPKPQRHGTITQCVTYAKITAQRIYSENQEIFKQFNQ